jgi:uncharacterized protein YfbU (UPF0304 family)
MELSKHERYYLSNQLKILEKLYPDEANEYAVQREAIEKGYSIVYNIGIDNIIDDDEMTSEECDEVWSVMEMFLSIDKTIEDLGLQREYKEDDRTQFDGYDGNNETKFMAFAEFTVQRDKRFTALPLGEEAYFNSHSPMRLSYNRMLEIWKNIDSQNRFRMSKEDLNKVLDARCVRSNSE